MHSLSMRSLLAVSVILLGACGDAAPDSQQSSADQTTSAKATLHFDADFEERLEGNLVRGGTLIIDYDASRLPGCRDGANDGSAAWTLTGFAKQGDDVSTFYVAGHASTGQVDENDPPPAALTLEREGPLELWFQVTSRFGCSGYDSNLGANYVYSVAPSRAQAATLTVGAEGVALQGNAVRGSTLHVDYDRSRMIECAEGANTAVGYRWDGGEQGYVTLTAGGADLALTRAGRLSLWFETNDQYGCHDRDDEGGAGFGVDVGEP